MADIRPFAALRPAPGLESVIAALPYDVYNRQEATEIVRRNQDSFLAIDRAETGFGPEVDTYAPEVYQRAARVLREWIEQGKFRKDEAPCYYLYELTMNGRSQTGIVACASVDDYLNGVIKKHENTRADKEQDRIRHVDACDMQTGPIFLAYRSHEILRETIRKCKEERPACDFVSDDGIGHRVWVIREEDQAGHIRELSPNGRNVYNAAPAGFYHGFYRIFAGYINTAQVVFYNFKKFICIAVYQVKVVLYIGGTVVVYQNINAAFLCKYLLHHSVEGFVFLGVKVHYPRLAASSGNFIGHRLAGLQTAHGKVNLGPVFRQLFGAG